jgi:nucleoside kinase
VAGEFAVDLLVSGHTNVDHRLLVAAWPAPDRTVPVTAGEMRLGGTAANLCVAAAHWGVRTQLASRVGTDLPAALYRELRSAGVGLDLFTRQPSGRTPTCYIVEDGRGRQVTLIEQGAMADWPGPALSDAMLRSVAWVHLTTGPPEAQLRLLARARAAGRPVAVDPAQEIHYRWSAPQLRRLVGGAELLFGNRSEIARAAELLGRPNGRALVDLVPMVVETRAAGGAVAYTSEGTVRAPADRPRGPHRVTGAGDAFRAGFYASWFAGEPLPGCLSAGNRSAAQWIRNGGRLPPRRSPRSRR